MNSRFKPGNRTYKKTQAALAGVKSEGPHFGSEKQKLSGEALQIIWEFVGRHASPPLQEASSASHSQLFGRNVFGRLYRIAGKFLMVQFRNPANVLGNRVVAKVIELSNSQRRNQSPKAISHAKPRTQVADSAMSVEINLLAHVPITHPPGRHSRNDIIVVDPAVVLGLRNESIRPIADSGCPKREDRFWIGRYRREFATHSTHSRHGAAQRVACEPHRTLILFDLLLEQRP